MDKGSKARLVLTACLGIFALALMAPVAANAQVTIFHVEVVVGTAPNAVSYCDTASTCNLPIWDLSGGKALAATNTLVLTQVGLLTSAFPNTGGTSIGGDFDTSDRVKSTAPFEQQCNGNIGASACPVSIYISTTNTPINLATPVYTNTGANPIGGFNVDPGSLSHREGVAYTDVTASLNPALSPFKLGIGYADTLHNGGTPTLVACTSTTYTSGDGSLCVPSPWDPAHVPTGGTAATFFIGGYMTTAQVASVPGAGTINCDSVCIDGAALVITANTTPPPGCTTNCVTVTQGGWGAPPHGNNPGAILAANFNSVFGAAGVTIGCKPLPPGGSLTFTSALAIQGFLPQGGTPGTLAAGNVNNPTTSPAGVFAGQVLALQLNVSFSGPVFPAGLASVTLTSGPAAGLTVGQVLGLANRALGGCLTPADIALLTSRGITTISQLNDIVDSINESFDVL
jgi:hypothetical protein